MRMFLNLSSKNKYVFFISENNNLKSNNIHYHISIITRAPLVSKLNKQFIQITIFN